MGDTDITLPEETFWQKYSTHFFLVIILSAASYFAYYVYNKFNNSITDVSDIVEEWAQVGDFFGGILNPIFSFLALIALLYTIILQSKELRLTRRELRASKKALQSQSDSLKLQNFENTFFNLLNNHKNSANNYSIDSPKTNPSNGFSMESITKGKKCFTKIFGFFNTRLKLEIDPVKQTVDKIEYLLSLYDFEYYLQEQNDLIDLILIGESQIPTFNFEFYSNIIKRQYSDAELIYFYCFHMKNNNKEHIDFLKRSKFFEKITFEWLYPKYKEVIFFFGDEVFGDNKATYMELIKPKNEENK